MLLPIASGPASDPEWEMLFPTYLSEWLEESLFCASRRGRNDEERKLTILDPYRTRTPRKKPLHQKKSILCHGPNSSSIPHLKRRSWIISKLTINFNESRDRLNYFTSLTYSLTVTKG